jgi:hypothetical protein
MKLLIKFPTRNRPDKFLNVLFTYIKFLDDKETEIIISADNDDITMNNPIIRNVIERIPNVQIYFNDNKTKIEAVNADLKNINFDIVLLASDDMIPLVKGYDTIIKEKMKLHFPDTDGVLWFNDGYQGDKLNTLCILGKKYYNRFNYIYYPEYKSCWCDNEFMEVANKLKKQIYFNDIIIKHEHPDYGHGERDIIHQLNYENVGYDNKLYIDRKLKNFDLC